MLTGIKQSIHPFRLFNLSILLSLLLHSPNALCVDYLTKIKPILAEKCYACHGTLKQESDLRLETRELMILGGDSGTVLDLINPRDSLLLERVNSQDSDRMPPEGEGAPLTTDQIALLNEWIKQGAVAPAFGGLSGSEDAGAVPSLLPASGLHAHQGQDGGKEVDGVENLCHPLTGRDGFWMPDQEGNLG